MNDCSSFINNLLLFAKLNNVKKYNDKYVIKLPYSYLISEINTFIYKLVSLELKNVDIDVLNIALLCENQFVDSMERKSWALDYDYQLHQCISSLYITSDIATDEMIGILKFEGPCRGFFIECDVHNITNINLFINGIDRWSYDNVIIDEIGKKINNNIMYIGFSNNKYDKALKCSDDIRDSFNGSTNLAHNNLFVHIKINFIQPQLNVGVHALLAYYQPSYQDTHIKIKTCVSKKIISKIIDDKIFFYQNRKINKEKNDVCPISFIEFNEKCEYYLCDRCNNQYLFDSIAEYMKIKNITTNVCPMCNYVMYPIIYTNESN